MEKVFGGTKMIFRVLNDKRMKKVRALWSKCFEKEGDPFFEYYFNEYCGKDNTVLGGFDEKDNLLTMLHLNPYMLQIRNCKILTPYIIGVATDEHVRGHHIMGDLLRMAFQMLRSQNFPFVFLMPIAEKIYSPYGFAVVDWHNKVEYDEICRLTNVRLEAFDFDKDVLSRLYAEFISKKNSVIRTDFQWNKLLKVTQLEGSKCELIKYFDSVVGYLFYNEKSGCKEIFEIVLLNDELKKKVSSSESQPFMMARCIDARTALDKLDASQVADCKFTLLLTDEFIEDNNHLLQIKVSDGKLSYVSSLENEDLILDMSGFVQLYFGAKSALELVEEGTLIVKDPVKLAAFSRLFPKCEVYFNEYF